MEHFISAPIAIQIHASSATLALLLGPIALYRNRRDRLHKTIGYIWITAMILTALSSFWISSMRLIGPFSLIHLLSIWTFFAVYWAISAIRKRNRQAHQRILANLYWRGLCVAGLLSFLPGRMMNKIAAFDVDDWAMVAILAIAALLLVVVGPNKMRGMGGR
jgi:uncharacterized membrane protein